LDKKNESAFDMKDSEEDLAQFPLLRSALSTTAAQVNQLYEDTDGPSKRHQWSHRIITLVAAGSGTLALLMAISSMAGLAGGALAAGSEIAAVVIAAIAVIAGIAAARMEHWLVERHRAERCRMAKFQFLVDPDLWTNDEAGFRRAQDRLERKKHEIGEITNEEKLKESIIAATLPEPRMIPVGATLSNEAVRQLVDYYRLKRLGWQKAFFDKRSKSNNFLDRITRPVALYFFLGSVVAALLHFVIAIVVPHDPNAAHGPNYFAKSLVFLSAGLPIMAGGVRTLRTASEYARNTLRYQSTANALAELSQRLDQEKDPAIQLHLLWSCEHILEAEHREWLRLMIDAEWI